MTVSSWWIVHLLTYLSGFWSGSAMTWLVTELVLVEEMATRHRLWRAITWLPYMLYSLLDWRRP